MITNWNTILDDATRAARASLAGAWDAVADSAPPHIAELTAAAQYIAEHEQELTGDEVQLLASQYRDALRNVLLAEPAIGAAAAHNAVAAVMRSLASVAPALVRLV
ncbi:hypothetical protein [Burkholderia glumae]|uniref:hypothetical protein n=1 Tax=Burkholderia glumae TaxID=337 RepID=UPI000306E52A|nr:hypothetical protein [Burkholderia glumae]MCM2551864.1 hypothetical protein [Burkholderia glumae]NVE25178.1 hypothetical protein [Burkholderia glumae]PJO22834.1 hypothetical protein Y5A_011940 [Burkholderia glumae AU6208]QGA41214.1 hypothetical protein GAS19_27900 [Burkholderia glumae]QHE13494.1 hypothetical protein GQR88_25045 [Burkholderia glumae AU6208]